MKSVNIDKYNNNLAVVPYHKVKSGFWQASNDVIVVQFDDNPEIINKIILMQMEKTKIGIPDPDPDYNDPDSYIHRLGFKSWGAYFKKLSFFSISITFDKDYLIYPSEKSIEKKYYTHTDKIDKVILKKRESDKIAEVVIDIFKKEEEYFKAVSV